MVAITGDTAASSFRMMLFMVLSSCGLRRHLGTGERTLLNVSWLIFEVENEFIRASAARGKCPIPEPSDATGRAESFSESSAEMLCSATSGHAPAFQQRHQQHAGRREVEDVLRPTVGRAAHF